MYKAECVSVHRENTIHLYENASHFYIKNNEKTNYSIVKIDGCEITTGLRCDYLIFNRKNIQVFLELKGIDVKKGIKQVEETVKLKQKNCHDKKIGVVVSTRCPLAHSDINIEQKRLKKMYNLFLVVKNSPYTMNFDHCM